MPADPPFDLDQTDRLLTTAHPSDQASMAEILGIPSRWEQMALLPVAHTTGGVVPSPGAPVEDTIVWNSYQG